jgi:hypothetical protein
MRLLPTVLMVVAFFGLAKSAHTQERVIYGPQVSKAWEIGLHFDGEQRAVPENRNP